MAERLYQVKFDIETGQLQVVQPQEVTPRDFQGIQWPERREVATPERLIRFIQETQHPVKLISPEIAATYLREQIYTPFSDFDQEEMWSLLLDNKNLVTYNCLVYRGTVNTMYVRTAEIFKAAVYHNAPAIMLSHCHPSGDPSPSPEDIRTTQAIVQAGKVLSIEVLDHIIIGSDDRWVSLKSEGVRFGSEA